MNELDSYSRSQKNSQQDANSVKLKRKMFKTSSVSEKSMNPKLLDSAFLDSKDLKSQSLVAHVSFECEKTILKLKYQIQDEVEKNQKLYNEIDKLKKEYEDMKSDFESFTLNTTKTIENLKRLIQESEENNAIYRLSKDSTDDTISYDAGKISEIANFDSPRSDYMFEYQTLSRDSIDSSIGINDSEESKSESINLNDDKKKQSKRDSYRTIRMNSELTLTKTSNDDETKVKSKSKKEKKPSSLKIKRKKKENKGKVVNTEIYDITSAPNDASENESKEEMDIGSILSNDWLLNFYEFHFISIIGKGCASTVYSGTYQGKDVAIKVLKLENQKKDLEDFKKEMYIMSTLRSDYIVHFYGASLSPKLCIVLENCINGTLFHYMQNENNILTWSLAIRWMTETAKGINTLHQWTPQIVHRDLKTLNLLLDSTLTIKVCDFGLSRFVSGEHDQNTFFKLRGTYAYIAPEIYHGRQYTSKSDVYSFGIILWEIIHRVIVGKHQRPYGEYPKIIHDFQIIVQASTRNLRPTLPESTPPILKEIFMKCVDGDPDVRPSCQELIELLEKVEIEYKDNKEDWNKIAYSTQQVNRSPSLNNRHFRRVSKSPGRELVRNKQPRRNLIEDLKKKGIDISKFRQNNKRTEMKRMATLVEVTSSSPTQSHKIRNRSVSHSHIHKPSSNNNDESISDDSNESANQ